MPEAYASIATSVTSIKGKDHKIAEEHTETLGIFLRMVSQVHVTFLALKGSPEDQR